MPLPTWAGQRYTLGFLSEEPLWTEMKVALRLLSSGRSWNEVRKEILDENLFQLRRLETVKTRLKLVGRRLAWVDTDLARLFLRGDLHDQHATLLYTFLASYRLPREFVLEEIRFRWLKGESHITSEQAMAFFERKREQGAELTGRADHRLVRAKQVTVRLLTSYRLLERAGGIWYIHPLVVSDEWRNHVQRRPHGSELMRMLLLE
jgi:hypothetical protein